jgi:SRSO17 transposase
LTAASSSPSESDRRWAWVTIDAADADAERSGLRWLLIRRNNGTGELAYYRCYAPEPVPLRELVRVAGRRWTVEESFQASKGLAGLDQHQVRRWISWQRWTVLAMLAHAFLAVLAATEHTHYPDA